MSNNKKQDKADVLNTKEMLKEAAKEKKVIRYNDRKKVEITSDNMTFLKKGDVISIHPVVAERYVSEGKAKYAK